MMRCRDPEGRENPRDGDGSSGMASDGLFKFALMMAIPP